MLLPQVSISTPAQLRAWVASTLGCAQESLNAQDRLIELGMSSLAMMRLPVLLKKAGLSVTFAELMRDPTLGAWERLVAEAGEKRAAAACEAGESRRDARRDGPDPGAADMTVETSPFPLTEMQMAYLLGRQRVFELGGIAAHGYLEIACEPRSFSRERLERALNESVKRHPMLRMRTTPDGRQEILPRVPRIVLALETAPGSRARLREAMRDEILPLEVWPPFKVRLTQEPGEDVVSIHLSFDIVVFDIASLAIWLAQWHALYAREELPSSDDVLSDVIFSDPPLPGPSLSRSRRTFADYVRDLEDLRAGNQAAEDRLWWEVRAPGLPPHPLLPLCRTPRDLTPPAIARKFRILEPKIWHAAKKNASMAGVTPASLFATVLAETLARHSESPELTLNLTLFDRMGERAPYDGVVGDFTSMIPLPVRTGRGASLKSLCRETADTLLLHLSHAALGGTEIGAAIARARGIVNANPLPVVLTCAAGGSSPSYLETAGLFGRIAHACNQAPQTWIDVQVVDMDGGVAIIWDYVEGLFPDGLVDGAFDLFLALLEDAAAPATWEIPLESLRVPALSPACGPLVAGADAPLFAPFLENASKDPLATALEDDERAMTYGELEDSSRKLALALAGLGAGRGELVGVLAPGGWRQIVAVLGILRSGAAYLPMNVDDPASRLGTLAARGRASLVLTADAGATRADSTRRAALDLAGIRVLSVDELLDKAPQPGAVLPDVSGRDRAYVIFTSGSTGEPKGVEIEHAAALNTVLDVARRNDMGPEDAVLGVSRPSFDLSVFDLFGPLATGGRLVLPPHSILPDPSAWAGIIRRRKVTVWNSVPALVELLLDAIGEARFLPSLRLFLLSGDWLPVELARRIRSLPGSPGLVSMGGATEAAIWSVAKVVDAVPPTWKTVPYGKALTAQSLHVLDSLMRPRPVGVPGDIHIAGAGLARGYLNDTEQTRAAFVHHPGEGARFYRTGDRGRLLADGDIEFLGRLDGQVKIQGTRIELGEVEAALRACPDVARAVVVAAGTGKRRRLVGFVVPQKDGQDTAQKAREFVSSILPGALVPPVILVVPDLPLTKNGKTDRAALVARAEEAGSVPGEDNFRPPVLESESQKTVAAVWLELLGRVPRISTSFFDAGGTSSLALQLAARLSRATGRNVPVLDVFRHTTIASQARHIVERHEHGLSRGHADSLPHEAGGHNAPPLPHGLRMLAERRRRKA